MKKHDFFFFIDQLWKEYTLYPLNLTMGAFPGCPGGLAESVAEAINTEANRESTRQSPVFYHLEVPSKVQIILRRKWLLWIS